MATVSFNYRGKKRELEVPQSFFNLPPEQQKATISSMMGGQKEEEGGLWDATKDVAKGVGGGMATVLRGLGKPQGAVAGGLFDIQKQRMALETDEERANWEWNVDQTLEAMKKGFTYEDEKRMQDLMAQSNPEWVKENPVLSTVLGFGGDVLTDPLNLVGIGLVRKALGGFGAARKLSDVIGKTSVGAALANAADNPVLRAFNVYTGDKKKAREAYLKMVDSMRGSQGTFLRETKINQKSLKQASKDLGVGVDDLERQILREAEGMPDVPEGIVIPDNLTGAARERAVRDAKDMEEMFGSFLAGEKASLPVLGGAGGSAFVKGADIDDVMARSTDLGIEGYVPHLLNRQGRRKTEGIRDILRHHPSMKKRRYGGSIESNSLSYGDNFFITDVPTIMGERSSRNAHVIAGKEFLKDVSESLGRLTDEAPMDWVAINGVEGVLFDPKVAPFINKMYKTAHDPKELGKFLKFTDSATRWWKMWSLGLRPAYHSRNVVGNLWNAYNIGGMDPVSGSKWFAKAGKIQNQSIRGKGFSGKVRVGKEEYSTEDMWNMAMEDGVLNHGQYGADVTRGIERFALDDAPRGAMQSLSQWVTPSTKNRLLKGGFATGRALENNTRLALYMNTLAKTGSRTKARANVKKSLFDYGDLSPFEQDVMKRLIPFYTWSRKNIPAQIEALIKNPQRAVKVEHLIDNIQYGIDTPNLEEVNDFISNRNPVFLDKYFENDDVHNVITLMNWLPLMDPDRLLDWKPVREGKMAGSGVPFPSLIAEMTNPYIKSVFEAMVNYDIYRRRDIQDLKGQKIDFLGVRMPVHLAKLAQNLVMLSEFDRLNPSGMFGEAIRDDRGRIHRTTSYAGAQRESRVDQPMSQRILQYLVGLRPYEVKADQKKWDAMTKYKDYQELISLLRKALMSGKTDQADDIRKALRMLSRPMEGR
tara:strand:- start:128 stop:2914 length:2787 start_codon:yes stop_codon:yes gene_type:complete